MLPLVYDYLDYRRFLRDWYTSKKKANPRFSHRAFVRRTGQRSPSLLADVMESRRNLTQAGIEGFCRALAFDDEQAAFFAELVHLDQAETPKEKEEVWSRISKTRRFREAHRIEGEAFASLSYWYYPAIRELACRSDFRDDPVWVAAQLRPTIEVEQARQALATLQNLEMIVKTPDGFKPSEPSTVTPPQVIGLAVHNYHKGMTRLGHESIDRFEPEERQLYGITAAIPATLLPQLELELQDMVKRLLDIADGSEGERDLVVQMNLQLFPLSKPAEDDT
jgi:uncharacterized protein (TIGR02147 family)